MPFKVVILQMKYVANEIMLLLLADEFYNLILFKCFLTTGTWTVKHVIDNAFVSPVWRRTEDTEENYHVLVKGDAFHAPTKSEPTIEPHFEAEIKSFLLLASACSLPLPCQDFSP